MLTSLHNTLSTFSDVFKSSFLENFQSLSVGTGVLIMAVSILCGLLICFIYKITYRGVLFSRSFCLSLLAMEVITTLIILTVTSNVVLSLGMVGALSIIRFRSAIKEPMDIAFLYYAICAGIMCGANLLSLAILGVLVVGAVLFLAGSLPAGDDAYILMISVNAEDEDTVAKYVVKNTKKSKLKSKTLQGDSSELIYEVTLIAGSTKFMNKLNAYPAISSVTLVKSSGEYI